MSIIFFEGFNSSDNDIIKLDPQHWSTNDQSKLNFYYGRTDSQIFLANRPSQSGLPLNTTITLSNFANPLATNSGFGIGVHSNEASIRTGKYSPYVENLISFYSNSVEVLRIDIVRSIYNTVDDSLAFAIYQNNNLVDTYDLKSSIGYSWQILQSNSSRYLYNPSYIEIYVNPTDENMAIRLTANNTYETHLLNSSNNIYTSISGFNNLNGIKFYGSNSDLDGYLEENRKTLDDLYLTAGNSLSECLLGHNSKIYRRYPNSNTSIAQWSGTANGSQQSPDYYLIDDNNGDTDYIYSHTSGNSSLYNISNINEPAPSGVGGVKVINVVRKSNLDQNVNFINIMTSGDGGSITEIGSGHLVNSTSYNYKNTFFFNNPITNNEWTKQEVNNMQLGVKII